MSGGRGEGGGGYLMVRTFAIVNVAVWMLHSWQSPFNHEVSSAAHKLATSAILPIAEDVAMRARCGTP